MKTKHYLYISFIVVCLTLFIFAYQQSWIIIRSPFQNTITYTFKKNNIKKKIITLCFWHNNKWHQEKTEIHVYSQKPDDIINYITNAWLKLLHEEHIIQKKIALQSVLISPSSKQAYISFSQSPLDKENSTHQKWLLVESLLKTLRENNIDIQSIYFLVHHQPLNDQNLNFSNAWPLEGFL